MQRISPVQTTDPVMVSLREEEKERAVPHTPNVPSKKQPEFNAAD